MHIANQDREITTGSSSPKSVKCIALILLSPCGLYIREVIIVLSLLVQAAVCQHAITQMLLIAKAVVTSTSRLPFELR